MDNSVTFHETATRANNLSLDTRHDTKLAGLGLIGLDMTNTIK